MDIYLGEGLDVLATKKRETNGVFRSPADRTISAVTSIEDDEKTMSFEVDKSLAPGDRGHTSRRYRSTNLHSGEPFVFKKSHFKLSSMVEWKLVKKRKKKFI